MNGTRSNPFNYILAKEKNLFNSIIIILKRRVIITSKYYKPAFPLQLDDDYIYPKTTADQVIVDETSNLQEIIDQLRRSVIIQYTHSSSGLTSSTPTTVENGKFKAYDTMDVSSMNINGTTYNVNAGTIKLTKNSWYMFFLDFTNQTMHFLSSSGASSEDFSAFYITYNTAGGTLPLDAVTNFGQTTPSFMLPTPTKTGYTFEGWYANENLSGNPITQVMQGTKNDLEFYAKWQVNSYTYNIVYKSSSGVQLGTATVTYNYDTTNTISPKAFTGYTSPSAQSIKWDNVNAKTITFTYTPITYTITYNLNGGSLSGQTTSYTIEDNVTLKSPTKSPETFAGWYTSSALTGSKVSTIAKGSTGNKTYYAKWQYIFFPNSFTSVASNWSGSGGTYTIDSTKFYQYSSSAGSSRSMNGLTVDFSKYKKIYTTITGVNNDNNFDIRWRRKSDSIIQTQINVNDLEASQRVKTHEQNISSNNEICYLVISGDHGGGGTITKIWFE